jgi:hypothetical protein
MTVIPLPAATHETSLMQKLRNSIVLVASQLRPRDLDCLNQLATITTTLTEQVSRMGLDLRRLLLGETSLLLSFTLEIDENSQTIIEWWFLGYSFLFFSLYIYLWLD